MRKDYLFRPYRLGDEEQIVELLNLVFDGWPKIDISCTQLDHWRWKYLENPLKRNFISVGISNDKIIGVNHAFPVSIKMCGEKLILGFGTDTVVHPDYRRRGIRNKMLKLKNHLIQRSGIKLNYMVTSNPIIISNYLRNNLPRFPQRITNAVKINDINLHMELMPTKYARAMKLGFHAMSIINTIKKVVRRPQPVYSNLHFNKIQIFDDRINLFWNKVSDRHNFIVERRKDYLNWRYCDPRAGDFVTIQAEDDEGHILGYNVLKVNRYRKEYPIGYILDLLTIPDRADVADALISRAIQYFDEQNINIINSLIVKNYPYERIFSRYGFLDSKISLQLFLRPHENLEVLKKLETCSANEVYFSYGDIDSLPVRMPRYVLR